MRWSSGGRFKVIGTGYPPIILIPKLSLSMRIKNLPKVSYFWEIFFTEFLQLRNGEVTFLRYTKNK